MDDLRKNFEKLAKDNGWNIFRVSFANGTEKYSNDFTNGAWYAFQEQQKKIDAISKYLINSVGFEKDEIMELLK